MQSQLRPRGPRRWLAGAFLASLLAPLGGCVPAGHSPQRFASGEEVWQIPQAALMSQRLYRISYQGPDGKLSFRLTLYLVDRASFRMEAADGIGRRIFSLELAREGRALWLDHRNEVYCRLSKDALPRDLPLAKLPLEALPRLLLGVMPAKPARELAQDAGKISYRDAAGQQWSGSRDAAGVLEWWTLVENGEAVAYWQRQPTENIYSDRKAGLQVRLQEQVVEPLVELPQSLEIPRDYRESACSG